MFTDFICKRAYVRAFEGKYLEVQAEGRQAGKREMLWQPSDRVGFYLYKQRAREK